MRARPFVPQGRARDFFPNRHRHCSHAVIASAAKQSTSRQRKYGLLRFARNDGRFPMRRFALPLLLAIAGLILFGQGGYIHAKGWLAQILLERAFTETVATGRDTKPWSWA